jgi:hypothetical protein
MIEPGVMGDIDHLRFEIRRFDPYPTELAGAVEHSAWWDAMALRQRLERGASHVRLEALNRGAQ